MPSVEKADIKVSMADQILERLHASAKSAEDNAKAMRAGAELLKREYAFHKSIKEKLRQDLDQDRATKEEFDAATQVLTACVMFNQKLFDTHLREAAQQAMLAQGLHVAIRLVEKERQLESLKRATGELEDEEELDLDSAEEELDRVLDAEAAVLPEEPKEPRCAHCGEEMILETGGALCVQCTSYRNRYSKLPPPHVLKARQERKKDDSDAGDA